MSRRSELLSDLYTTLALQPQMVTVEETDPMWDLKDMQDFVGGLIERVSLYNGDDLIINEEGLYLDLPMNLKATQLFYESIGEGDKNAGLDFARKNKIPPILGDVLRIKGGLRDA